MKDFYYTVHEWMFKDLKLSGSELTIYAVIYRYANVENQYFTMTIRSLAEHLNLSNATVQKCINSFIFAIKFKEPNQKIINHSRHG